VPKDGAEGLLLGKAAFDAVLPKFANGLLTPPEKERLGGTSSSFPESSFEMRLPKVDAVLEKELPDEADFANGFAEPNILLPHSKILNCSNELIY